MSYAKTIKVIDLNLLSGSSDTFRNAFGGYWKILEGDYGESLELQDWDASEIRSPYVSQAPLRCAHGVLASTDIVVPALTYPIRIWGEPAEITDDNFWKVYCMGGTFGDATYEGILKEDVYDDYWFWENIPYSQLEVNTLVGGSDITEKIEISYDYNFFLKDYQNYVDSLSSELLIPNMYLLEMVKGVAAVGLQKLGDIEGYLRENASISSGRYYDVPIISFISLEGRSGTQVQNLFWDTAYATVLLNNGGQITGRGIGKMHGISGYPDPTGKLYELAIHSYYMNNVPLLPVDDSTKEYVENALQNIMFDQNSIAGSALINTFSNMEANAPVIPYYAKINFPREYAEYAAGGYALTSDNNFRVLFAEAFQNNNYSPKLLKTLKEIFNEEIEFSSLKTEEYIVENNYLSSSAGDETDAQIITAENTSFRTIDFFDLLSHMYNQYESQTDNCFFVGERSISREVAMDTKGTYKYLNSKGALGVLRDTLNYLTTTGGGSASPLGVYPISDSPQTTIESTDADGATTTSNVQTAADSWDDLSLDEIFAGWRGASDDGKYKEIIAYRVEKIGGAVTGDSKTQKPIQNFWIFNSTDLSDINLFDSQIKYGQDYTYKVYAYEISVGVRYKLSDFVLSRQTSTPTTTAEGDTEVCIEFFDPATGEATDQLYTLATSYNADTPTTAVDRTGYPYLADANITYEPTIKLFEIPLYSKTLKVLDHPPNQLNLNPFFLLDNSQTIGFKIEYEVFVDKTYPITLSATDEEVKADYMSANDMLEDTEITLSSRSQQRFVQVYRLAEKPSALTDFDGNLLSTIDLKIENSQYTLPNTIFYDKINTNQKYYYLFRCNNENGIAGWVSEIYEAELVNDGGYVYGMFDILFEEDLEIDNFINPSANFKKLIQLQPNISQINFNDENVDYSDSASNQLANMKIGIADDPIWDQTFKIRLTSKKTGKKMDLNVTYKYETDSN